MKKSTAKIWTRGILVACCGFILTAALYFCNVFTFLENKTYDSRMVGSSKYVRPDQNIIFIAITQDSLDWAVENYGWSWPWPRKAYAQIIDFISAGNGKSIAFDLMFDEPSIYGPEDDREFARAEKDSGKVIQSVFVNDDGKVIFPIPELKENAALIGNINSNMDNDDIIRRGRFEFQIDEKLYPSLGFAPIYLTEGKITKDLPFLENGTLLLRYQNSVDNYTIWPAHEILEGYRDWKNGVEGYFTPDLCEGAYFYLGVYASGLFDICSTPVNQVYAGVGVHITTLDNYLHNSFIHKVPVFLNMLWILFLCFAGSLCISFGETRHGQKRIIVSIVIWFAAAFCLGLWLPYYIFRFGIWLLFVAPLFGFGISFVISLIVSFMTEGKQKRFLKSAFSQCLSKDVVNQIVNNPDSFKLGGDNFHMSAIFTDIQKFSSFSELLTAGELGQLLNFYLTRMSEIIIEEHGTVDKYEGDAIVAMVGAPIQMEDHAARACRAAIKMKKTEVQLNEYILQTAAEEKPAGMSEELYSAFKIMKDNNKTLFTRIGINSGEMIAGYFGSENKKNYTMMGNNVNLASRLEGVNKQYSTGGILISEATRNLLDDSFVVRSLDRVRVVNVNTPIRLYELIGLKDDKAEPCDCTEWESALSVFENGNYDKALAAFKVISEKQPEDKVALYYINLLEKYFTKGSYPTEQDGEGVAFNPEDKVFKLLQK